MVHNIMNLCLKNPRLYNLLILYLSVVFVKSVASFNEKTIFLSLLLLFISIPALAKEKIEHQKITFKNTEVNFITVSNTAKLKVASYLPNKNLKEVLNLSNALAVINAGYFNHSNGDSVSYVVDNNKVIADPTKNNDLMTNKALKPIMGKILKVRGEFRIIKKGNSITYDIANRNIPEKNIVSSLQAGPILLPSLDLEKEGFIIKNKSGEIVRDSISYNSKTSRSAIGLKSNGDIVFMSCSGKNNEGITIKEEAELMSFLGCKKALNLDGGSSVSLVWKEGTTLKAFIGKEKNLPSVNSSILVLPD